MIVKGVTILTFFGLIIITVTGLNMYDAVVKRVECLEPTENYVTMSCKVKLKNRTTTYIQINGTPHYDIVDPTIRITFLYRFTIYRQFLIDVTEDFCGMIKEGRPAPVISLIWNSLEDSTNIDDEGCPMKKEINLNLQENSHTSPIKCEKFFSSMGKCISKVSTGKSPNSFGSTQHLALSEKSFDGSSINEGQSESKKNSKKERANGSVETKGTAMSFGFRKKSAPTGGKKNGNVSTKEKEKITGEDMAVTVIGNRSVLKSNLIENDKNGNSGSRDSLDEAIQTGRSTPRLSAPKKEIAGTNYRSNRFGFRQSNVVRPASTGLTPKIAEFDSNSNNNFTDKRRSKSASGSASARSSTQINEMHQKVTNQPQNPKIATASNHQNQQSLRAAFFEAQPKTTAVRTGFHTNDIIRPTPQLPVVPTVTKFTLHTANLPRPQVPVPISLTTKAMDSKGAKQALNTSRRSFFAGTASRDTSLDSGISSYDSSHNAPGTRKARVRQRNLEVVMNGRHTFQVRDLDDSLSDETIVPLALPKLPSAFQASRQPAPTSGLIRIDQPNYREFHRDSGSPPRKPSIPSDIESLEEDGEEGKLFRDKAASEKKGSQVEAIKDFSPSSKQSSPGSSRASWGHGGESMAHKDFSSLSLSSDDSKEPARVSSIVIKDEDITSITFTLDQPLSSANDYLPPYRVIRDAPPREDSLTLREDTQFAEMAAAVSDILLDDETSPTDSLVSSCTDTDELMKKNSHAKRKSPDGVKTIRDLEKDIDEISPELDDINLISPVMVGTPTHASTSLSLSEAGRDFLIDDEIADQPALVFNDQNETASNMQASTADTVTLHEVNSVENLGDLAASLTQSGQKHLSNCSAASVNRTPRRIPRSESLDTLSPCESIASDDLMIDYQSQSSLDSVDRVARSNGSGGSGSALHSMDENQLWSELEAQGGELLREWSSLLRVNGTKPSTRDSITSQLPARATRLLNRSRLQSTISTAGSDSPRSLDGVPRRTQSLSKTNSPHLFRESDSCSPDGIYMDKSMRNSMIQDIVYFKKQLLRLKCLLQEGEPLNSFEHNNGQIFASCAPDSNLGSLSSLQSESASEDPRQEMAELRRQTELDDRDRTIKIQKNIIAKYEAEKLKSRNNANTVESATQTERVKPISTVAQDQISRTESNGMSQNSQRCITTTTSISFKSPTKCNSVKPVKTTPIGNVTNMANSQKYVRSFSVDDGLAGKCSANKNGRISSGPLSLPMVNGNRKIPILTSTVKNPHARVPRSSLSSSRSDSVNSSSSSLNENTDRKSLPVKILTSVAK
ncbi:uncharacterized protein LOC129801922 isoform X4 [Phlebotomus papatasi]|uniref:uncharacterized protein LOC129801922 isoform X4 n=1 Tax=Phlebotomus papatasi TaxID=29031 RepID=UPI00248384AA|nr:uncharacterized protein LOC129801922 isoform X4 [Phlebotomus papatasi]